MNQTIQIIFDALKAKEEDYTTKYRYYDGDQPLKYSTERMKRAFADVNVYFAQNWISVIVSSVLERLVLKGFTSKNTTLQAEMEEKFKSLHIQLDAYDVHEAALVTHEGFIIVDVVEGEKELYFNDPRMVHVQYNPERPKEKLFAGKKWTDEDGLIHITVYLPDTIEDWTSKEGKTAGSFKRISSEPNSLKGIPVFHFRIGRRTSKSLLDKSTISIQDAINKLFSDMMVSAEFTAFKMRVFISQADPGQIKIGPDLKLWLPAREGKDGQDTDIKEIGGDDLEIFIKPMTELANSLAATTRTPKHYFFSQGEVPSGEALISMEAPLVKKTLQIQENLAVTWQELGAFLLNIDGGSVKPEDIEPVWMPVETVQPLTQAQIMKTYTEANVPVSVAAKKVGWDSTEISELPVNDTVSNTDNQNN